MTDLDSFVSNVFLQVRLAGSATPVQIVVCVELAVDQIYSRTAGTRTH